MGAAEAQGNILAGDVGGTKTVLALFEARGEDLLPVAESTVASADWDSLDAIAERFLEEHGRPALAATCVGVAGPVIEGAAQVTNLTWRVDEPGLARATGAPRVKLLNDLEATAFGMLFLDAEDFVELNSTAASGRRGNVTVIAAGTGLGEALLIWDGERHHPVATEGGHGSFAPHSDRDFALLRHLQERYGHVSTERVVSGQALIEIYRFLRQESGVPEPDWLTRRIDSGDPSAVVSEVALAGDDPVCGDVIDLFVANYGSEAGNLALRSLALGGVLLGGGIAPKLLPRLQDGAFMQAFVDKGRFADLLRSVRVAVCRKPDTAMLGAARYAQRLLEADA